MKEWNGIIVDSEPAHCILSGKGIPPIDHSIHYTLPLQRTSLLQCLTSSLPIPSQSEFVKPTFEVFDSEDLPTVLIVEDNLMNQKLTAKFLEMAGCGYDVANNGLEAVNKYKEHNYDIVLMDCQMPVMVIEVSADFTSK